MNRAQVYVRKCLVSFEMCYCVQETITRLEDMTQNRKMCSLLRKQLETSPDATGIAMAIESPLSVSLVTSSLDTSCSSFLSPVS